MAKFKKLLVCGFILLNFMSMIRVNLPLEHRFFSTFYKPVDAYLSFFSIYQDWLMFAPNPSRVNIYLSADVEFIDGTRDTYLFPRPSELNIIQKYINGERYRKIVTDAIRNDTHSWMWPDTAKYALRKMKEKHFSKIPARVHLSRYWDETPDVNEEFRPHRQKAKYYQSYRFYTLEVI